MKLELRDYPRIAIFVGLIAALSFVPLINIPGLAPITAQTLGVMLAGAVLGAYRGTLAVLIVELLSLVGLHVLSSGKVGLEVLTSPYFGYTFGWLIGAWVIGAVIAALPKLPLALSSAIAFVLGGIVAIYVPGLLWLSYVTGAPLLAVTVGNAAYLIGDAIKIVVAVIVVVALKAAYPKALTK